VLVDILFLIILCAVVVSGVWYLWESHQFHGEGRVWYVGSSVSEVLPVLDEIIVRYVLEKGESTDEYSFIEPGAGLALISGAAARKYSWKSVEAIELGGFIRTLGKLRLGLRGLFHKVTFYGADIFFYEMPTKAVVYCYLLTSLLDRMHREGKLKNKLVVCLTFPLTDVKPSEVFPIANWQGQVYVYDFR
jgi:hypothetical protein